MPKQCLYGDGMSKTPMLSHFTFFFTYPFPLPLPRYRCYFSRHGPPRRERRQNCSPSRVSSCSVRMLQQRPPLLRYLQPPPKGAFSCAPSPFRLNDSPPRSCIRLLASGPRSRASSPPYETWTHLPPRLLSSSGFTRHGFPSQAFPDQILPLMPRPVGVPPETESPFSLSCLFSPLPLHYYARPPPPL